MTERAAVSGSVHPGFEPVREAFAENFRRGAELGAACSVYCHGEKVVDLWGGVRDKATGEPWEEGTMALTYSMSKGLAGMAMALAQSRGYFDYDDRVSTYWPEFSQQGKERITIRQLFAHQAGLFCLDEKLTEELISDPDRLAVVLARQKPRWPAGSRQAYHGITLGFYQGELLRRTDPEHRTLGQFFQEEIASPLGLDAYIRLPEDIPDSRLAKFTRAGPTAAGLFKVSLPLALAAVYPYSRIHRCLRGSEIPEQSDRVYARNLEVPSGGAVGTARAFAHAYGVFATGGKELGLREETFQQLRAPAVAPVHGFRDACLKQEIEFSLGFAKPGDKYHFAHPSAFGMRGWGGSFAFADPHAEIGYAYIPNRLVVGLDDARERSLRIALYRSIGETVFPDTGTWRGSVRTTGGAADGLG